MTMSTEIRFKLQRIGTDFACLTDVYVNGVGSFHASYLPYSDSKYILINTQGESVGIGTVNHESVFKATVCFKLTDGAGEACLTSMLWRSKYEIKWNDVPVLLRFYRKKQRIPNSSIVVTRNRRWFSIGDLLLAGDDADFEAFNPILLIGIFYYVYTNSIMTNRGD